MPNPTPTTAQPAVPSAAPTAIFNFKAVLQQLVQRNASDLHLKVGRPPTLRLHGDLVALDPECHVEQDVRIAVVAVQAVDLE